VPFMGDIFEIEPPALIGLCEIGEGPVVYGNVACCGVDEGCEPPKYVGVGGGLAKASWVCTGEGCVTAEPGVCPPIMPPPIIGCCCAGTVCSGGADIDIDVGYCGSSYGGGGRPSLTVGE